MTQNFGKEIVFIGENLLIMSEKFIQQIAMLSSIVVVGAFFEAHLYDEWIVFARQLGVYLHSIAYFFIAVVSLKFSLLTKRFSVYPR